MRFSGLTTHLPSCCCRSVTDQPWWWSPPHQPCVWKPNQCSYSPNVVKKSTAAESVFSILTVQPHCKPFSLPGGILYIHYSSRLAKSLWNQKHYTRVGCATQNLWVLIYNSSALQLKGFSWSLWMLFPFNCIQIVKKKWKLEAQI